MTVSYVKQTNLVKRQITLGLSLILALVSLVLPLYQSKFLGQVVETSFLEFTRERLIFELTFGMFIIILGYLLYSSRSQESILYPGLAGILAGTFLLYFISAGYIEGNKDLEQIQGEVNFAIGFLIFLISMILLVLGTFLKKEN